ncbi:MAG: phosphatase PAP2 family protein [Acidimicrobiales bacterium]
MDEAHPRGPEPGPPDVDGPERGRLAAVDRLDQAVDEWWESLRGAPVLDRLFYTASQAADFSLVWHTLGVGRGLLRHDPRSAFELSVALGLESALVNGPVKAIFGRVRPRPAGSRPHHLRQPRSSSFPSGHASAAMVAAAMLSRDSRLGPLWYGLALVVATSRIHVRIHHASDVVGGLAVGGALGAIARRLTR